MAVNVSGESAQQSRGVGLGFYIAGVALGATVLGIVLAGASTRQPGTPSWPAMGALAVLLVVAEYLFVRFRFGGEVNALNLVEAVLVPLIYAFPPAAFLPIVALAQVAGAALRRNSPVKAAFNVAQWTFAAGVGGTVLLALGAPRADSARGLGVLLLVMAAVGVTNQILFMLVIAIADSLPLRRMVSGFAPVIVPGWVAGWTLNTLVGVLFVLAYAQTPFAVLLFPVPLIVLHLAYRGFAGARTDRVRLAGLPRAARALTEPVVPTDATEKFLREVAACFEARAAALVLPLADGGRVVHSYEVDGGACTTRREQPDEPSLAQASLGLASATRIATRDRHPIAPKLLAEGWRDCLAAPLLEGTEPIGALLVLDQTGLEGFEAGELAVVESLAREVSAALGKGRLLNAVLAERTKLSEIVTTTSDGIMTIDLDGIVRSWNPAMERLTALRASAVVDVPGALGQLVLHTLEGEPVDLEHWSTGMPLPKELRIVAVDGGARRLSCSYSSARADEGDAHTLVVVARDVTNDEEIGRLRREFGRLAQAEAAQRAVVEQLQQAVMPARPPFAEVDLGVSYVASDPREPTGGDLYDWQALPSGHLHVAVVDVLGHGVAATKDALAVVHALRLLALEGCPLAEMVERADALLVAQNPDLVATVVVARYDPSQGVVRLAGGGHPPALHLSSGAGVKLVPVPGGAIGWPQAGSELVAEVTLEPGDALVLYTDGLVEAKKDILQGTETLVRHARSLIERPADELAEELVYRSLSEGDRRDDSLALVMRRSPAVVRLTREIDPDLREIRRYRQDLGRWLVDREVPANEIADLVLIAGELVTNAVAAARSRIAVRVSLDGAVDGVRAAIEVEDDGRGRADLQTVGMEPPGPDATAGRGLFLVRSLADDVSILSTQEGTIVRAARVIAPAPSGGPGRIPGPAARIDR